MTLQNDRLLKSLRGEGVDRPPVWLMRQAGRILPQYRELRETVSFKELVTTPELSAKVTIQPVDELGVDAAILFSDILVVAEAMGIDYELVKGKGPVFENPIRTKEQVSQLAVGETGIERVDYVGKAVEETKKALNDRVPLIGFAGGPWTLMAFMVEGQSSKKLSQGRRLFYQDPETAQTLLDKITQTTLHYLKMQQQAGVDAVQIFESFAGLLTPHLFYEYLLPRLREICRGLSVPVVVFAKDAHFARHHLSTLPCEAISLDWTMAPQKSRKIIGPDKTLQGNLDPCTLYGDTVTIRQKTEKMVEAFGPTRYIANLGHGVYPDTPLEGVKCFINTVQQSGSS